MQLLSSKAQPDKQRIIDDEPSLKQAMIVIAGKCRESERNRMQSGRFLGDVVPGGVRATHDQRQSRQRGLALKSEDPEHGVERAVFADMAQFDILDVEWNATAFTRHVDHLIRIDEEDARVRIEKATDQPGAGDAI